MVASKAQGAQLGAQAQRTAVRAVKADTAAQVLAQSAARLKEAPQAGPPARPPPTPEEARRLLLGRCTVLMDQMTREMLRTAQMDSQTLRTVGSQALGVLKCDT